MTGFRIFMTRPAWAGGENGSTFGPAMTWRPLSPFHVCWILFVFSIACRLLWVAFGEQLGIFEPLILSLSVACGFAWLFARSLFNPDGLRQSWPIAIVAALTISGAILNFFPSQGQDTAMANALLPLARQVHSLTGSAVLLLTLFEALHGRHSRLPAEERRFRFLFMAGYGALFTGAVLLEHLTAELPIALMSVKTLCACLALVGGTVAMLYRTAHPLNVSTATRAQKPPVRDQEEHKLAQRIDHLLREKQVYTHADFKVADLADRLGAPDYKVTRCITGALGYPNFNQLINRYRIEHARNLLSDPTRGEQSILSIALDSGFGSIGPFNRAFKAQIGMTPGAYRRNATAQDSN